MSDIPTKHSNVSAPSWKQNRCACEAAYVSFLDQDKLCGKLSLGRRRGSHVYVERFRRRPESAISHVCTRIEKRPVWDIQGRSIFWKRVSRRLGETKWRIHDAYVAKG